MSQGGTQVKKEITKLVADFAKNSQRFSASVVSEATGDNLIMWVSDQFCEMGGYPRGEVIGRKLTLKS